MAKQNGSGNGTNPAGRVVRVIGPVADVEFPPEGLPEIHTALTLERPIEDQPDTITCEVAQQVGDYTVPAIAMKPTDGVVLPAPVQTLGRPIAAPEGDAGVGHAFDV